MEFIVSADPNKTQHIARKRCYVRCNLACNQDVITWPYLGAPRRFRSLATRPLRARALGRETKLISSHRAEAAHQQNWEILESEIEVARAPTGVNHSGNLTLELRSSTFRWFPESIL